MKPARILTIAGSDSSGGAGIQADIKTIAMLGGYAMSAITAVTAQNTLGVTAVEVLSPELVCAQIDACIADVGVDAIKIGMLGSAAVAEAVAQRLERIDAPVVFDPVMVATSGAVLADKATMAAFARLMRRATLASPNLPEVAALGGEAAVLAACDAVLIKGGHGAGDRLIDRLAARDGEIARWEDRRIETRHTHGTGCTLASAIATGLGQGLALVAAIDRARRFVRLALHDAPGFGGGHGPLGHQAVRLDCGPDLRLNQVTLPADDYAASVAFYRALGLAQIVDSRENGYARFECPGGATLSIALGHGAAGGAAAYFECGDLDAVLAGLAAKGIAAAPPLAQAWLWCEAWLEDPAGNPICLYQAGENRRHPPWRL